MKIAVGTDDKRTIRKGHFGESRYYLIIDILNAQIVAKDLRNNPYFEGEKARAHHGQAERIIKLLGDCTLFMAISFGKKSVQEISSRGIDCITTSIEGIDQAISSYLDGKVEDFSYYNANAKDYVKCSQRPYK
jgi:predicted Fe-Mo cluster-binding NifX family protein